LAGPIQAQAAALHSPSNGPHSQIHPSAPTAFTIHHLTRSQSERTIWLCEELDLPYDLKVYPRSPVLAPSSLKSLHPSETAPIITDGALTLAESGAITEYILTKYGNGRLQLPPNHANYTDYLYWLHFANATLQLAISRNMFMNLAQVPADNPIMQAAQGRRDHAVKLLGDRLRDNEWLAGETFTAADIMSVVCVSTMRLFSPFGLEGSPGVVRWLERVGTREAYRRAMEKGDPGMEPVLGVKAPKSLL